MTKVKVKALQTFSHGNNDAQQHGTYSFNKGDAQELEKAGFVQLFEDGESEQTQVDAPAQVAQPGDVVVDNGPDMLGAKAKMADAPDNKMVKTVSNKTKG